MTPAPILIAGGALTGLVVGSFIATAAIRSGRGESVLAGRSHCDGCALPLGALETLPLLGGVLAKGRCKACGGVIDPLHMAGEALGLLVVAAPLAVLPAVPAALTALLGLLLLAAALIDLRTQRLPDGLTLAAALLGGGLAAMRGPEELLIGLAAAAVSALALLGLRALARRRRAGEPGLGLGDVKLIAALALWLGLRTPAMLALASLLGLITIAATKGWRARIPFGPMIAASAFGIGLATECGLWP